MSGSARRFQDRVIEQTKRIYRHAPISKEIIAAFYEIPRHLFASRYYGEKGWIDLSDSNLEENLPRIYEDDPLVLCGTDEEGISTISQPSFVLRMLDLLQIKKGMKIFELGTGSGWNAALLAHLTGPSGFVVSVEIIPELVERARLAISKLGLKNLEIICGDGGEGASSHFPYDRAVFTAGAYDLPRAFYGQIKVGGLLLFVLRDRKEVDKLLLMEKMEHGFRSLYSQNCAFVPMTGRYRIPDNEINFPLVPAKMKLIEAYPIDFRVQVGEGQWLQKRNESQFLWSLLE